MTIGAAVQDSLSRRLRTRQSEWRSPAVVAGVVRDGELVWSDGAGVADVEQESAGVDGRTPFAIGSITKTFTAALVLRLRDQGALQLDDPIGRHLPTDQHARLTIRELLAHASGLQREPVGDVWETLVLPSPDQVVRDLDAAERLLPVRLRWHYSNLAYALLAEVVARVGGQPYGAALQAQLLDPLGLKSTSLRRPDNAAVGYHVEPWTDQVRPEPWPDLGAFQPAGGLWSTVEDLGRWAWTLIAGADDVLPATTIEEMSRPEIMADLDHWTLAWGLGLELNRSGERIFAGHSGGMPGYSTGLAVCRADRVGAIALCNATAGTDPTRLAVELVDLVLDAEPAVPEPWRPGPPVPDALAELVGPWWSESSGFTFSVRDGRLEARLDRQPRDKPPAVFEPAGPDRFRTVSGREQGEWLRVERAADGTVARLNWAGYPFTRQPGPFGPFGPM